MGKVLELTPYSLVGLQVSVVLVTMEECLITKLEAWEDTQTKEEATGKAIIITLTTVHRCHVKRGEENVTKALNSDLSLSLAHHPAVKTR